MTQESADPPFEVEKFSRDAFYKILSDKTKCPSHSVVNKDVVTYLVGYLADINCQTIVIENDYIDRDYLEGYAGYYARCFKPYGRHCTRLHFFKIGFSPQEFSNLIDHGNFPLTPGTLQYAYLGFVVLRPLPLTIIGRTCLLTYPLKGGRDYPITRSNHINLYGIDLNITTLPFQEQDSVVAACATSALWSVFQKTGELFNHHIPSPMEITESATSNSPIETRTFPNREGLSHYHMVQAMQTAYLEPIRINVSPLEIDDCERLLKANAYAYLRGHVPLVMTFYIFDESNPDSFYKSLHGVAVTGFRIEQTQSHADPYGCNLRAYRITKLYAHDDQIGPFARMEFDNITFDIDKDNKDIYSLSTQWNRQDKNGHCRSMPNILLVPLYHKIRIPFETVLEKVSIFNVLVKNVYFAILTIKKVTDPTVGLLDLEWDIYLTTVNEYKESVFSGGYSDFRSRVLLSKLPKYIWRATLYEKETRVFDLIFDATDIEQGKLHLDSIEHNKEFANVLRAAINIPGFVNQFHGSAAWDIIEWFMKN